MYTFLFSFTALPISANLRIPDQMSNSIEVKSKQFAIFNELEISGLATLGFFIVTCKCRLLIWTDEVWLT